MTIILRLVPQCPTIPNWSRPSNFSFLRGGSHPEELAITSATLGLKGFGLTDRNSFAGVVRAYVALRDMEARPPKDFRYLVGTRLCFADGTPDIVAYPTDREAYGRLCKLLSIGNQRGEKGAPKLQIEDLLPGLGATNIVDLKAEDFAEGQLFIFIADETDWPRSEKILAALARHAPAGCGSPAPAASAAMTVPGSTGLRRWGGAIMRRCSPPMT